MSCKLYNLLDALMVQRPHICQKIKANFISHVMSPLAFLSRMLSHHKIWILVFFHIVSCSIPVVLLVALLFYNGSAVLLLHTSAADYTLNPASLLQQLTAGRERGAGEATRTPITLAFLLGTTDRLSVPRTSYTSFSWWSHRTGEGNWEQLCGMIS